MEWPKKGSVLAAAWFATTLCLLMLGGALLWYPATNPVSATNPAFPAFFSFLPVVFFMIARAHQQAENTIRELRERVEALEASAKARKEPANERPPG
jgi:TRAP-type C4-dicarboxylate transport system permease small subunit